MPTILALPTPIQQAIADRLAAPDANAWMKRAQALHLRYTQQEQDRQQRHVADALDALAYLGLRASATYAQIWSAVAAVYEILPSWQPTTLLDLGCGPGSGLWALSTLLPSLQTATCVDQNAYFLALGKQILQTADLPQTATWQQANLLQWVQQTETTYDLVLLANVLNELTDQQRTTLLDAAFQRCNTLLLILEPGTPMGSEIVQAAAQQLAPHGTLLAPYLGSQFVPEPWLHFPQRFTRPNFARRLRQAMRASPLMASDWEEAKYSYVAIGKVAPELLPWGRVVGPVQLRKGYLEVPLLTATQCDTIKVLKRHKQQYAFARKLRWGETIPQRDSLFPTTSA